MTGSWLKSLQCKSRAYDDVHPFISSSCRNANRNLKDVVIVDKSKPRTRSGPDPFSPNVRRSKSVKPSFSPPVSRERRAVSGPVTKGSGLVTETGDDGVGLNPFFPSVEELVEGHPSRNVVEIIFQTRWGSNGFSGRVEMVFKVQTSVHSSARFEEYRELIKLRAGLRGGPGLGARCVADGNEMMRFHCLGPTNMIDGCDGDTSAGICTYSGSGAAHDSAGTEKGRRAMVVCRVIAGRVLKRVGLRPECMVGGLGDFDSVTTEKGELLVYDSRAVLPCFLVIYKL